MTSKIAIIQQVTKTKYRIFRMEDSGLVPLGFPELKTVVPSLETYRVDLNDFRVKGYVCGVGDAPHILARGLYRDGFDKVLYQSLRYGNGFPTIIENRWRN